MPCQNNTVTVRPIYLQERVSEEAEKARKALEEKYTFSDVRHQKSYPVLSREHPDINYIYEVMEVSV